MTNLPPLNNSLPSLSTPLIRPDQCVKCKFSSAVPQQRVLQCRRNPPQASVLANGQSLTVFPLVQPDQWCGEFRVAISIAN